MPSAKVTLLAEFHGGASVKNCSSAHEIIDFIYGRCAHSTRSWVDATVKCPSVRLSVCPVDRQQQRRRAAGLLAPAADIDRWLPFLQILPTLAFLFFFRTDSTDSPDGLPILLSVSVFYFSVFLLSPLLKSFLVPCGRSS